MSLFETFRRSTDAELRDSRAGVLTVPPIDAAVPEIVSTATFGAG